MAKGNDTSFYTVLRYEEPAEEIISRFARATRGLIARLIDDLETGARGEFGGGNETILLALAEAGRRVAGHVDVFERIALAGTGTANLDGKIRNVVANILSDANLAGAAEAHSQQPRAVEGKFDQHQGGDLTGHYGDLADKLWQIVDILPKELSFFINIISLLLRDIGIWGKEATGPSLTDIGKQLEDKLDYVIPQLDGIQAGQDGVAATVGQIEQITKMTQQEVNFIEQKAETLADLLGRTLVGASWQINPIKTVSGPNKVPARDVKQELHDIEDLLRKIIDIIDKVPNGNGNGALHDTPKDGPRPVLVDRRIKKIFVFAENVFSPKSRTERRRVRVNTHAFDLSGWIDLSQLRPGDVFEVDLRVSFAGRRNILFARTHFDQPRLLTFADFAKGQNYLSGSDILISIRQSASANKFTTKREIAYQFIVESQ
jgi:hypothetical protein